VIKLVRLIVIQEAGIRQQEAVKRY
jgi:hypothetical protein